MGQRIIFSTIFRTCISRKRGLVFISHLKAVLALLTYVFPPTTYEGATLPPNLQIVNLNLGDLRGPTFGVTAEYPSYTFPPLHLFQHIRFFLSNTLHIYESSISPTQCCPSTLTSGINSHQLSRWHRLLRQKFLPCHRLSQSTLSMSRSLKGAGRSVLQWLSC